MEIVVRTPHGSADVAVEYHAPRTTLGALISHVTGQAVPAVALVDGRTVSCAVRLDEAGLLVGSLIETDAPAPRSATRGEIVLGQVAGPGAGRTPILAPGRHRVGPGRRVRADELAAAPVDEVVLEIEVGPDAVATVEPGAGATPMLGGAPVTSPMLWPPDDVLVVGRRAFVIRPRPTDRRRRIPAAPDGTTPVHRQPRRAATAPRQPVIDARHDAHGPATTLWERRLDHPDALAVTVGVHAPIGERPDPFVVDLDRHRIVAVTGHESSRGALTRALLVDAATVHGPADLELVVVTSRPAEWDWAKWLPHLRRVGLPMVLADDDAVAAWMTAREHVAHETVAPTRTLLVVDGSDIWQRGTSPVRQVVSAPPVQMSIVALGDDPEQVPEHTDLLLAETAEQHWTATSFVDGTTVDGILAALVESDVASDIARSLASCNDPDRPTSAAAEPAPHTLDTFVTDDDPAVTPLLDGFGFGTSTVVVGPDDDETARATAAFALRACLAHPPESLVLLDLLRSPWTAGLTTLPHAIVDDRGLEEIDPERLVQRLAHQTRTVDVLALADAQSPLGSLLLATSRELPGLSVLATTTEPTVPGAGQPVVVTVHRAGRHRRAVVQTVDRRVSVPLDDDGVVGDLVVRPFAVGRLLSPLERRLDRLQRPDPIHFVETCRRLAADQLAPEPDRSPRPSRPPLLPPAMPALVDAESLLRDHPGDGVPIGIVDDVRGDPVPLWWIPGQGSVVAVGPPPSGVAEILGTVLVGLVDRFGVDDVELVLVDQSAGRRRTVGALPICSTTAAPNDDDSLIALVGRLEAQRPAAAPLLVVVIDDLGFLLRRADRLGLGSRLRAALGSSTTSVVATARSVDDVEPLPADRTTVLLGSAFEAPAIARPPRGRCRRQVDGALVQLATLDQPLGAALAARTGEDRP
ncbi:MAG TPA: hypothetical protein VK853_03145 [Ilumatobacteraceae bacterium]|nr:hypothetical protein [Ilumatobacteraceae bacterium]